MASDVGLGFAVKGRSGSLCMSRVREEQMPKAYLVAHIRVHDDKGYEEFKKMAGPAIADHGGRVLVRNPEADHREETLRGSVRERAAETDLLLVEGDT
jgi:hypothetical protein